MARQRKPLGRWGPNAGTGAAVVAAVVRILSLFYTLNFTTYSSKVDYTMLTLVPRQDTIL